MLALLRKSIIPILSCDITEPPAVSYVAASLDERRDTPTQSRPDFPTFQEQAKMWLERSLATGRKVPRNQWDERCMGAYVAGMLQSAEFARREHKLEEALEMTSEAEAVAKQWEFELGMQDAKQRRDAIEKSLRGV
jgi:hypothetical protein